MLFQVAALFARSLLELSLIEDGMNDAVAKDLSWLVVPPILIALMFPYLKLCKVQLLRFFRLSDLTWRLFVLALLLGITLRVVRWAVLTVLIRLGVPGNEDANALTGPFFGFDCPSSPVLILSLCVTAFLIPILEETINRGFILHALLPRGIALSIGISSLCFALMHPPVMYVSAFLVGILLATQTLNCGTLWAALIAHSAYNAIAVIDWECFRIVWNPPPSDPQLTILSIIAAPIAVLGTGLAILIVTRRTAGAC